MHSENRELRVRRMGRAGFPPVGAAWVLKPLRTDSVSRGLSISLSTRVKIFSFNFDPALSFHEASLF